MLNVPKLDDLSYQQIFEQARSLIPTLTEEWTDFNDSDPGIVMLQLFAWLTDTLNFYLDSTGDAHRLKYLKLLGIMPEKAPARCMLAAECTGKETVVPRGARFAAGNVVFEAAEGFRGAVNRLSRVYAEADGDIADLTRFAGMDGDWAQVFSGEAPALYLGFENPLTDRFRFYAEVWEGFGRNPFDTLFSLVRLEWESYDGTRWNKARFCADETGGFLKSGFVELELEGVSGPLENPLLDRAYYLRCRVVSGAYDVLPRLGRITVNCFPAEQTDTAVRTVEYVYDRHDIPLDFYVRPDDFLVVAVRSGNVYVAWYEFQQEEDSLCEIVPGEFSWQWVVRFDKERFGIVPEQGAKIMVMVISQEIAGETVIGITDGCAGQRVSLPFGNVYGLRLALTGRRNGRTVYRLFDDAQGKLSRADGSACLFELDGAEIVFGDSIHGVQPERGWSVEIASLTRSLLERGNVRRGAVTEIRSKLGGIRSVKNLDEAAGGILCQNPEDLETRVEDRINAVNRAASREDYRKIVLGTPGLLIDSVNVISMQEYREAYPSERETPNTVLLAVKPRSEEPRPALSQAYQHRILEHLEQYRLLTVFVRVVPARYVAVTAYGRVALRENNEAARRDVEACIRALVEPDAERFGRKVDSGKIFSTLEMMDGVRKISRLSFEYEGEGGRKEANGDIVIFPDAMAWISGFSIEYL